MGKVYSQCLGRIIDKTAKWKTTGIAPKKQGWGGGTEYYLWREKQPPMPEKIGICDKCGEKYYNRRIGFICYKRFYQKKVKMKNKIKKTGFIDSLQDILDDFSYRICLLEVRVMNNRKMIEDEE